MNHDLEIALARGALSTARAGRDHGNTILLIGILTEVAIDTFWRDRPRVFSQSWREHFFEKKTITILIVGLVIVGGLMLERRQGSIADDKAEEIQGYQQEQIADAENRLADAQERIAKILVNVGPTETSREPKRIWGIKQFAGTPFLVQELPTPYRHPDEDEGTFQARFDIFEGSLVGARSFLQLTIIGWVALPHVNWRCPWMPEEIVIYSRHGKPLEVRLDTPEAKAWSAGEALTQYMHSTGLDRVEHLPIRDDANGNPTEQLTGLILPKNGIFITVGPKNSNEGIEFLQHELEVGPDR
jgi:hypothetical protein